MLARLFRFPLAIAFAAGLVSATGFAPLDLWPVALACFAVLLWLTHTAPSLKGALLRGCVLLCLACTRLLHALAGLRLLLLRGL